MRRALVFIALNNLLMLLGFNVWQAIFSNFAVEELGIRADEIGLIQAIREVPGLMAFLVGVLALLLVEMRIAGLSVVLMGAGIVMTATAHDLSSVILATLVMSIGFHFFYASYTSAALILVSPTEAPKVIGRLNSLGALASVASTLFVIATLNALGFRNLFALAGAVVLIGGVILLPFGHQPGRKRPEARRPPVRRRYWLYYTFELLMGSRRHIFSTFAVFLLVREYGVSAQLITLLFLINSLIGMYLHQAIGKLIVHFGERRVLAASLAVLVVVFVGYAVIPLVPALHAQTVAVSSLSLGEWVLFPAFVATPALLILLTLFVADNILFGFALAAQTYFQKIALMPEDITPNISLGQTINHVAAVIIPIVGGVMWETVGAQYTFLAGLVTVVISLALTRYMRLPLPEPVEALATGR